MPRRRLPPFVQARRTKTPTFRGWAMIDGKRIFGPSRHDPDEAYEDARRMRRLDETTPRDKLPTIEDGFRLVQRHNRLYTTQGNQDAFDQQIRQLRKWPAILDTNQPLLAITRKHVDAWVEKRLTAKRAVKPATVAKGVAALGRVYNLAIREGWVFENPVQKVGKLRVDTPEMHWFTRDQLLSIIRRIDEGPARDMVVLLAYTGVRRGELVRLRCRDVSIPRGEILVRGKRDNRVLPIDADLAPTCERMLARAGAGEDPLIPGGEKEVLDTFAEWKPRLDEPWFHPHAFRHTYATMLVQAGVRLDVVQYLLGHRTLAMVLRYVHQHGPDARDAVGRLRLLRPSDESSSAESGA